MLGKKTSGYGAATTDAELAATAIDKAEVVVEGRHRALRNTRTLVALNRSHGNEGAARAEEVNVGPLTRQVTVAESVVAAAKKHHADGKHALAIKTAKDVPVAVAAVKAVDGAARYVASRRAQVKGFMKRFPEMSQGLDEAGCAALTETLSAADAHLTASESALTRANMLLHSGEFSDAIGTASAVVRGAAETVAPAAGAAASAMLFAKDAAAGTGGTPSLGPDV